MKEASTIMCCKQQCLQDVWDEWYGLVSFYDINGCIEGREKSFEIAWRKGVVSNHHFQGPKGVQLELINFVEIIN